MGGHAAGEIASRVAADAIEAFVQQTEGVAASFRGPSATTPTGGSTEPPRVRAAAGQQEIAQRVIDEPALRGMATTAVCLLIGTRDSGLGLGTKPRRLPPLACRLRPFPPCSRMSATRGRTCGATASWISSPATTRGWKSRCRWRAERAEARQHPWRNLVTRALAAPTNPRSSSRRSAWSQATACSCAATASPRALERRDWEMLARAPRAAPTSCARPWWTPPTRPAAGQHHRHRR